MYVHIYECVTISNSYYVVIRTIGDKIELDVDAPQNNVNFYGFAKNVQVNDAAPNSLHVHGTINNLGVENGHVKVENTGIIFYVAELAEGTGATITNQGYIADAASEEIKEKIDTAEGSKEVGGDYEINSLARLESFRDTVNSGNDFAGMTVKLTADIELKDGWKPIGEASRKSSSNATQDERNNGLFTGNVFRGVFDGQNHTISNLNNKGFIPTANRLGEDYDNKVLTSYQYAYGLFGSVGTNNATNDPKNAQAAIIKNVKLKDVDIDTSRYSSYNNKQVLGDCVAGLVGYAFGNVTISGIEVLNGSIKGTDAVAGVVGRGYPAGDSDNKVKKTDSTFTLENCKNAATIEATGKHGCGVMGFTNSKQAKVVISSLENTGRITCADATYRATLFDGQRESAGSMKIDGVAVTSTSIVSYDPILED